MDKTCLFDVTLLKQREIEYTLQIVYRALMEKGYDPINQIVGYLVTGDASHITSHNNARNLMQEVDRDLIIAFLLEEYLK